jgi:hypothetical protein
LNVGNGSNRRRWEGILDRSLLEGRTRVRQEENIHQANFKRAFNHVIHLSEYGASTQVAFSAEGRAREIEVGVVGAETETGDL